MNKNQKHIDSYAKSLYDNSIPGFRCKDQNDLIMVAKLLTQSRSGIGTVRDFTFSIVYSGRQWHCYGYKVSTNSEGAKRYAEYIIASNQRDILVVPDSILRRPEYTYFFI